MNKYSWQDSLFSWLCKISKNNECCREIIGRSVDPIPEKENKDLKNHSGVLQTFVM